MWIFLHLLFLASHAWGGTVSVRDAFDCKMRAFALEFAEQIQPFRPAEVNWPAGGGSLCPLL
jgi:hypothetical protein